MNDLVGRLKEHVSQHEALGATRCDRSLGIRKMPEGYALMLNRDESHFYWLKFDGSEGFEAWDKWYVYHSATMNSESCEIYAMLRGKLGASAAAITEGQP